MTHPAPPRQNIQSIEQLRQLQSRLKSLSPLRREPDFEFDLPELPLGINREIGLLMNGWKGECGCTAGGLATGAAVLFAMAYGLVHFRDLDAVRLALLFSIVVVCALLGKVFGILRARVRMHALIRRVFRSIQPTDEMFYRWGGRHG